MVSTTENHSEPSKPRKLSLLTEISGFVASMPHTNRQHYILCIRLSSLANKPGFGKMFSKPAVLVNRFTKPAVFKELSKARVLEFTNLLEATVDS